MRNATIVGCKGGSCDAGYEVSGARVATVTVP